jgi:hypothetical protein
MGDLFANLNKGNIQLPDAKFNANGPLPPTSNPNVHYTTSKINKTDRLLSGIDAYDYGDHKYTSDDIAYQNIPVKIQKIIPPVHLPGTNNVANDWINITHPVDDGDLAFVLKIRHSRHTVIPQLRQFEKQDMGRAIDCLINLPTVNYILRGLQTQWIAGSAWEHFFALFETSARPEHFRSNDTFIRETACELFVRDCIAPFGVVIGSEDQGGQHEGTNMAVDWPVNFVATLCIDGFNENMVNMWRRCQVGAGDQLMLILANQAFVDDPVSKTLPPRPDHTYNLNHYYKARVSQKFPHWHNNCFQLIPTTHRDCDKSTIFRNNDFGHNPQTRGPSLGMWHIATSQVMSNMAGNKSARVNYTHTAGMASFMDDMQNLSGSALLQTTFAPVWQPTLHERLQERLFDHFAVQRSHGFHNRLVRQRFQMVHMVHHQNTFGSELNAHDFTFNNLKRHCIKNHNMKAPQADQAAFEILSKIICNPTYVTRPLKGVAHANALIFTQAFHDEMNGVAAPVTASTSATAPVSRSVRKPAVPLFQQVAVQQKASQEVVLTETGKESTVLASLDKISSTKSTVALPADATQKTPEATPLEPRKRKTTAAASAIALSTETSPDKGVPVSRKVDSSVTL